MVVGEARLPKGEVVSKEPAYYQLADQYPHPALIPNHEWRKVLTPEEFYVCRMAGQEPSFCGILTKHSEKGRYNCRCCGTDLFLSSSKFYSGHGSPTFTSSLNYDQNILRIQDTRFGLTRIEVKCKECLSHLGHIVDDKTTETGERYHINSTAINFDKEH